MRLPLILLKRFSTSTSNASQLLRRLEDHRRPFGRLRTGIEDPPVIIKIVSHLGLPTHAPPRSPARPLDFIPDNLIAENCLPTKPTIPFALTWTERHDNATLRARPVRFRLSRPVQERVFHPPKKI